MKTPISWIKLLTVIGRLNNLFLASICYQKSAKVTSVFGTYIVYIRICSKFLHDIHDKILTVSVQRKTEGR